MTERDYTLYNDALKFIEARGYSFLDYGTYDKPGSKYMMEVSSMPDSGVRLVAIDENEWIYDRLHTHSISDVILFVDSWTFKGSRS